MGTTKQVMLWPRYSSVFDEDIVLYLTPYSILEPDLFQAFFSTLVEFHFSGWILVIFVLIEPITLKHRLRSPYLELRNRQKRRERRSVSTEKNVEMLMVADKTMYEFYKGGLQEYLLTIANMVCSYCYWDKPSCQTYLFCTFFVSILRNT